VAGEGSAGDGPTAIGAGRAGGEGRRRPAQGGGGGLKQGRSGGGLAATDA
jgi:hypothetical protein